MNTTTPKTKNSEDLARKIVKRFLTKSSKRFGSLVLEVDNTALGSYMKKVRLKAGVKAINIAREMGCHRSEITVLEAGAKPWNFDKLVGYISALDKE